jgi:hypothetical protein
MFAGLGPAFARAMPWPTFALTTELRVSTRSSPALRSLPYLPGGRDSCNLHELEPTPGCPETSTFGALALAALPSKDSVTSTPQRSQQRQVSALAIRSFILAL